MAKLKTVEAMQRELTRTQEANRMHKARIAELERAIGEQTEQHEEKLGRLHGELSDASSALADLKASLAESAA